MQHKKHPAKSFKTLLNNHWYPYIGDEFDKPYMMALADFLLDQENEGTVIYPKRDDLFKALNTTPFDNVRVVILGQDPYHGEGQAHGLSFSVPTGVRKPPSLVNIYKEIEQEYMTPMPLSGDLTPWAKQGVLLLNSTLTVEAHLAGSHQKRGWETFTDQIISTLAQQKKHIVFMLWGSHAQKKVPLINTDQHLILQAPHPSPLSAYRGFLGCGHFKTANTYLAAQGYTPIKWVNA